MDSYRQIMKATSIFGGVQVFQILIKIIQSKFIAILLGPTGMGIAGLLTSTTAIIGGLTSFGLGTSAVKNVATANATNDFYRVSITVTVLKRLLWITGCLGTIITILLSPWLSEITFGNNDYTFAFVWLSVTLLLTQLSSGQMVILQGLRKLKYLAQANLYGSVIGLVVSVPLYYLWGIKGIVPALIISAFFTLLLAYFFGSKIKINKVKISLSSLKREGSDMAKMGFMLSLSGLIAIGASYFLKIFISRFGYIEDVGLYNAGFAIINTYVGLVFTAMGTDYFPRLSEVADSNLLCKQKINQQAEIALLILAPIIAIFLVFINWIVILLYSDKFIAIQEMVHWAALGMFFKAMSWAIAFVLLAKGNSKLFFWNELIVNIYMLLLNMIGYKLFGLNGLGISFLIGYVLYLIQVYFLTKIKYQFNFEPILIKIFGFQFIISVLCFALVKFFTNFYSYLFGIFFIVISLLFSLFELNKRVQLISTLHNIKNKIFKKRNG